MLYHNAVVEKDGNITMTKSMKEFADKNYFTTNNADGLRMWEWHTEKAG